MRLSLVNGSRFQPAQRSRRVIPAIRAASLTLPDGGPDLLVQVRHITPIADAPSGDRCFLGVEFIGVNSSDRRAIGALLQAKK